jgi:hypothetical protein
MQEYESHRCAGRLLEEVSDKEEIIKALQEELAVKDQMTQSIIEKLKQENALLKFENSKMGKDIEILK